jgi:radical SAM protein with 4Fe4S-binding SPASM domain
MSLETFRNALGQIKPYTDYIYFHVKGEPLLHPGLDEFLDVSHEMGFQVNITTNGTLIDKVKDKIMTKPALRQINFSLHSFGGNEEAHYRKEYIHHILAFVEEALNKSDMMIALRLWNLDPAQVEPGTPKNREILDILEKAFQLDSKIQEKAYRDRGIKITDRLFLNQDHEFKWPDINEAEDDGTGFCYGLRSHAAILADGTVVPCCLDGNGLISLGNIKDRSFSEIIKSNRAMAILDGFSKRLAVEELCRKCGYRKRFGAE